MIGGAFRLQKFSNISQEACIYEIIDEHSTVLMDVTRTDAGVYEACITDNEGKARVIELSVVVKTD